MRKILTIVGARPQFVKASVVAQRLRDYDGLIEVLLHTGQHFDHNMSDVFFSDLNINKPDYFLDIHGGNHGEMTGRMLIGIEEVLIKEKPDAVLVYGDTNSTLAGAIAAAKLHIPVAHVEAGLRSFNMRMPEEVNRMLTDKVSKWLFAPSEIAINNLKREGFSAHDVYAFGDVMYDVALRETTQSNSKTKLPIEDRMPSNWTSGKYCLLTIHRAENTDNSVRLAAIVAGILEFAQTMPVVWPLHPRTRQILSNLGMLNSLKQAVAIIDPVGYLEMVQLEKHASLIATDSGGVQKEAYFYKVPCVTFRDETEWVELVTSGWNRLAPPVDAQAVHAALCQSLGTTGESVDLYGRGNAAELIAKQLSKDIA